MMSGKNKTIRRNKTQRDAVVRRCVEIRQCSLQRYPNRTDSSNKLGKRCVDTACT